MSEWSLYPISKKWIRLTSRDLFFCCSIESNRWKKVKNSKLPRVNQSEIRFFISNPRLKSDWVFFMQLLKCTILPSCTSKLDFMTAIQRAKPLLYEFTVQNPKLFSFHCSLMAQKECFKLSKNRAKNAGCRTEKKSGFMILIKQLTSFFYSVSLYSICFWYLNSFHNFLEEIRVFYDF